MELRGKSCYISGTIHGTTKKELRKIVERKGMKWSKKIAGDLDYLIVGEDPGQRKLDLAADIGIEVIAWEEFRKHLT